MQTDTLIRRTYRQFRLKAGMPARQALYAAQAKIETEELLERTGCWVVIAEAFNGHAWESCDSIGMNTGYENPLSPFENWYVPDLMANAVQAAECCQAEQLGVLTLR